MFGISWFLANKVKAWIMNASTKCIPMWICFFGNVHVGKFLHNSTQSNRPCFHIFPMKNIDHNQFEATQGFR